MSAKRPQLGLRPPIQRCFGQPTSPLCPPPPIALTSRRWAAVPCDRGIERSAAVGETTGRRRILPWPAAPQQTRLCPTRRVLAANCPTRPGKEQSRAKCYGRKCSSPARLERDELQRSRRR